MDSNDKENKQEIVTLMGSLSVAPATLTGPITLFDENGQSTELPEEVDSISTLAKFVKRLMAENEDLKKRLKKTEQERDENWTNLEKVKTSFLLAVRHALSSGRLDILTKEYGIRYTEFTGETGIIVLHIPRELMTAGMFANLTETIRTIGNGKFKGIIVMPDSMEIKELSKESIQEIKKWVKSYEREEE
jgi:hypothetical protein